MEAFKVCTMCGFEWKTQEDFLSDPTLIINGYQVDFEKLDWSLFLFTHHVDDCFSTIALEAKAFLNLYDGERYPERRTGESDCPQYCLDEEQLTRCEAFCECAFNRELIQIIRDKQNANKQ